MTATKKGHADCVRLLLDAGADNEAKNIVRLRVAVSLFRFLAELLLSSILFFEFMIRV